MVMPSQTPVLPDPGSDTILPRTALTRVVAAPSASTAIFDKGGALIVLTIDRLPDSAPALLEEIWGASRRQPNAMLWPLSQSEADMRGASSFVVRPASSSASWSGRSCRL